ncbi:MAG: LapA family protein [Casimicrobiaceae bacterium]
MSVLRWIFTAVIFVALLFISLQNAQPVTVTVLTALDWQWQAPLVFVILIAFAAGVALGLLSAAFKVARLKRQMNRMRREHRAHPPIPSPHGAAPGTAPATGPGFEPPTGGI